MEEKIIVRYDKSHLAKLSFLDDKLKMYYERLKNYILSFAKVKCMTSWEYDRLYQGRTNLVKLQVRGKTLRVYLALDLTDVDSKYNVIDVSDIKKYQDTKVLLKLKGPRSFKHAMELVDVVMAKHNILFKEEVEESYHNEIKRRSLEELLALELVKPVYGKPGDKVVEFKEYDDAELEEDDEEEEDEVLDSKLSYDVVGYKKENVSRLLRTYINLDTLCENFNANEVINLDSLKQKGLIKNDILYVKVLGRGMLTKPLHIELNEYSKEALLKINNYK